MFAKIKKQFAYTLKHSPFYQRKFKGIKRLSSLKDFEKLPFTAKNEILKDQENCPPFGENLCVSVKNIVRVHKTSGTTNKPAMIAMTESDVMHTVERGSACFRQAGLRKDDLVVHCLNYNMWAGGYTDHQSLERTGAAVVPFGVGNSRVLIETILHLKATAIHCTPSYLAKLDQIIKDEFHMVPRDLHLRLGLFGAESGLQNPDFRRNIEKIWGLKAMNANYGMSEVLSMFGAECTHQNGLHFMGGNVLYPELIDPYTKKMIPLEEGASGELILTNLCRQAQPLIRYRAGDVIKILKGRCPCKSRAFRFEIIGRSDDMLVIRGLNVFPSSIEQIINKNGDAITATYQIQVNKENPIDSIKLVLELHGQSAVKEENLRTRITSDFIERLDIRPHVEFVKEGTLPRTEGKSAKVLRIL